MTPSNHDADTIHTRLYRRLIDTLRRRREEIEVLRDDLVVLTEDNTRLRLEAGVKDDEIETLRTIIDSILDETQAAQMHEWLSRAADSELVRHTS